MTTPQKMLRKLLVSSGVALMAVSAAHATPVTVNNFSFEAETDENSPGVPSSWTAFNDSNYSVVGPASGTDYTVYNPLAAPADGNNYFAINEGPGGPTGGIYQDVGALQPNTVYTLTVAIGLRNDFTPGSLGSPGIISLLNGTSNAGTLLSSASGIPTTPNTWQNYTTTYTTGPTVSGDLTVELSVAGASTYQANFDNVRLNAVASVVPLPRLAQDTAPTSGTAAAGSNFVFTAAFSNTPPVSLQWQFISGTPSVTNNIGSGVVNVTNGNVVTSTLTLSHLQLTNAGSYAVEAINATNSQGVSYSTPRALTVIPPITWYAAGAYNGGFVDDTVLALAGPVGNEVYGVDFGGSGALTTANGYSFNDVSAGNMTLNGSLNTYGGYLNGGTTGDGNLDLILNNGLFGSTTSATLNNLTVGQQYTVMVLLDDGRSTSAGDTFQLTDGLTDSPAQQYAYPGGTPDVGGYIMGTFTALSTNEPLTVLANGGSQYNAVLLMTGVAPAPPNPPAITTDITPKLAEVSPGTPVTLSVAAQGATPLKYQWFNQAGAISGQTNATYTLSAVAGSNMFYVDVSNAYGSVDSSTNLVISSTNIVNVANFSFEQDNAGGPGGVVKSVPTGWTAFDEASAGDIGSQWADGTDYTVFSPLAPTASGNQFCYINIFSSTPVGGIYQDVGALQTNTVYTLTVAIGSRSDRINSPGIISLIAGTNTAGIVEATGGGLPSTQNTWQDYTVTFTNGTATGDLTVALSVSGAGSIQADFDNVRLTKAPAAGAAPVAALRNPSFEAGTGSVPAYWTAFNDHNYSSVSTAEGSDFTTPLVAPADGTNYFAINEGPSDPTGGIYQVFAALQPNTQYTLTVAIGLRGDFTPGSLGSPGIISLINGNDNTGTVLASTSGIPTTPNTWQDYSVTYATGSSVSGNLTVELSVAGASTYQADFDNVILTTAAVVPRPTLAAPKISGGNLILTATGGTPNSGYTLLSTTNLAAQVWITNSTGTLSSTGSLSNSIPIGTAPLKFFQVRVP